MEGGIIKVSQCEEQRYILFELLKCRLVKAIENAVGKWFFINYEVGKMTW